MKKIRPRLILTAVLVVLVVVFALQNAAVVEVKFLFWGLALPRSLLLLVVLLVGITAGWFLRG
ncbi:MAG: lipopolysaccharide assembly protein LapA domain-containing protein, partial [Gammaproteobacteria bacterium]